MNALGSGRTIAIVISVGFAIAACDATTPAPTPTGGLAPSAAAPAAATNVVVAPASTPGEAPPVGVPADAQPLLFGCAEGEARCEDIVPATYYTAGTWAFLPGLTFTLPAGWTSLANEAGELELYPIAGGGASDVLIWRDVVPWLDGHAVADVATDPAAWVAWLEKDPRLEVSQREQVVLGSWMNARAATGAQKELQALGVTVRIGQDLANEMADCPGSACIEILTDPTHWEEPFSIGRDQMDEAFRCPCTNLVRLYFASIGYPSHPHLFVVALQAFGQNADREADMARLQAAAQPILDSLIVPAVIVDN